VVIYFWRDIVRLARAWWRSLKRRRIETADERIAWYVFVATVPAAIAGAVGESFIERKLGDPWQIAILLAVFAIILWIADRVPPRRSIEDIGWKGAVGGPGGVSGTDAGDVAVRRHDHPRTVSEARP
jgi:undecaprenyl-diphosphatase